MKEEIPKTKRLCCFISEEAYYDLEDICKQIGRARGNRCTKKEVVSLAIMAFVLSYKANQTEKDD